MTYWRQTAAGKTATIALCAGIVLAAALPRYVQAKAAAGASRVTTQSKPGAPATSCSNRYHDLLTNQVLPKVRATQAMADKLRSMKPDMPGHWLFWDGNARLARTALQQRLMRQPQIDPQANRICERSILARGGRIRCLKWKPIPAGYKPPPVQPEIIDPHKTVITPAERLVAARLALRMIRKGRFTELNHGSVLYHIAQRTTDELSIYASQPHSPALCSGTLEMVAFYRRQLRPLALKATQARKRAKVVNTAVRAIVNARLGEAAQITTQGRLKSSSQLKVMIEPVLSQQEKTLLANEDKPLKMLQQVRDMLTDERLAALPDSQRHPLRKALRNIEFSIYANHEREHFGNLADAFETALNAIAGAHNAACTCGNLR